MDKVDLKTARAKIGDLVDRAASGEVIGIMRRGQVIAHLTPAQMEHQATDPQHRPLSEPLVVSHKPASWGDRNPGQAGRDAMLRNFGRK